MRARGFTLIELLVVMAIVATLLALAAPRYFQSEDRARETALRHDLAVMREAIDRFLGDTGRYPASLQDLVAKRYLRAVPRDPITGSDETWVTKAPPDAGKDAGKNAGKDAGKDAVFDVASGAPGVSREGTPYAQW